MTKWFKASITLAAAPLVFGTLVFLLWIITREDSLEVVGLFTIFGGLVLVLLGFGCLFNHISIDREKRRLSWVASARSCLLPLSLLIINFPVAFGFVLAAYAIEIRYIITVKNDSPATIGSFVVHGGGCQVDFGKLNPGDRRRRFIYIKSDGQLEYDAVVGGTMVHGYVDDYVTHNLGGSKNIFITSQGTIEVKDGVGRSI